MTYLTPSNIQNFEWVSLCVCGCVCVCMKHNLILTEKSYKVLALVLLLL